MKRSRDQEECEVDVTNCLMLLTKVGEISETNPSREIRDGFKCKTCDKRFSSFQALGGHRASHKKSKLMVADLSCHHRELSKTAMKPKMHSCPICGVEFAIGQALGGHMRKHRGAVNDGLMIHKHALPILKKSKDSKSLNLCLDLNLTPSENDIKLNLMTPVLNCFV